MSRSEAKAGLHTFRSRSKVELDLKHSARSPGSDAPFLAIIKVRHAGYVPNCVKLRTQISPEIITASVSPAALEKLEDDPEVVAVSRSRNLRIG
ncbi:MAG TPA: hypothetical protein VHQ90_26500 [Thermoanaerobaculia bacterium]|nr:hypothetical protein [Thermoanaerobaculia bacterium]